VLQVGSGGGAEWARDVAWCPAGVPLEGGGEGQLLAACSDGGRVLLWRSSDGFAAPAALPPFGHPVWRLSWSPTGRLLAVTCGDNSVTLWKEDVAGTWMSVCNAPVNVDVQ
jgi:protein transport protein SEC13